MRSILIDADEQSITAEGAGLEERIVAAGGAVELVDPNDPAEQARVAEEAWAKAKGFTCLDDAAERCAEHAERLVRACVDRERYADVGSTGIPRQIQVITKAIREIVSVYLSWYSEPVYQLLDALENDARAAPEEDDDTEGVWVVAIEPDVPGKPWVPMICQPPHPVSRTPEEAGARDVKTELGPYLDRLFDKKRCQ